MLDELGKLGPRGAKRSRVSYGGGAIDRIDRTEGEDLSSRALAPALAPALAADDAGGYEFSGEGIDSART